MFIGHFGVGFGARALAPAMSLGTAFLAAQFVDLLWPTLLLLGVESVEIAPGITRVTPLDFTHYPVSHSLVAVLGWAAGFALVYALLRRYRAGAVAAALAVVSHWLLDLLTHRPDLPLAPGLDVYAGLGLWQSLGATLAVETTLFAVGLALYLRNTRALDRSGHIALWTLVAFLLLAYAANVFGPPPPGVEAIAWAGQAQWLLIAWGYWVDRHRGNR